MMMRGTWSESLRCRRHGCSRRVRVRVRRRRRRRHPPET
jgi:hypothetical protein